MHVRTCHAISCDDSMYGYGSMPTRSDIHMGGITMHRYCIQWSCWLQATLCGAPIACVYTHVCTRSDLHMGGTSDYAGHQVDIKARINDILGGIKTVMADGRARNPTGYVLNG